MKVLIINGSPHENGTTRTALGSAANALNEAGIETEILWLGNDAIGGCMGCGYCRKNGKCIREDVVNTVVNRLEEFDGFIFGSPVHYAAASGAITSFMDRLFYVASSKMRLKPAAAIVCCRRGGASAAFDQLNKYFSISEMPIVTSNYWNQVHGTNGDEALRDEEGIQTAGMIGKNMAYLIKCIKAAENAGILPPEKEPKKKTNFIS